VNNYFLAHSFQKSIEYLLSQSKTLIMAFEFVGKLIEKTDIVQVNERFKKREFVLFEERMAGSYPIQNHVKFQLTQDKCDLIDAFQLQEDVKVSFNISGRKWEKDGKVSYFTNLEAWRIERPQVMAPQSNMTAAAPVGGNVPPPPPPPVQSVNTGAAGASDMEDDLPF